MSEIRRIPRSPKLKSPVLAAGSEMSTSKMNVKNYNGHNIILQVVSLRKSSFQDDSLLLFLLLSFSVYKGGAVQTISLAY